MFINLSFVLNGFRFDKSHYHQNSLTMHPFKLIILLFIFFHISCGETYIKYNTKLTTEPGTIRAKSPTLLLSYTINTEYILISKDSENVKTYYKLSIDDTNPLSQMAKETFSKNLELQLLDQSVLQKSKAISQLDPVEEENLTKIGNGPLLLKVKQTRLIPQILAETNSEQLILARIIYRLEEEPKPSDKSKLIATLEVLIYDKAGKLIFANGKTKTTSTYLPDDDISVANFMGDVLMATFKGKVNVRVNKHCRPILFENIKELWREMSDEIKKKIN